MDGENNGKPYSNGWFGGYQNFRKHPYLLRSPISMEITSPTKMPLVTQRDGPSARRLEDEIGIGTCLCGKKPRIFWRFRQRPHLDVSLNGGTQQPWVFLLKMIILGCFGGTTIYGNTHFYPVILRSLEFWISLYLGGKYIFYPGSKSLPPISQVIRHDFYKTLGSLEPLQL